jgi:nicotinamidase-related amidase
MRVRPDECVLLVIDVQDGLIDTIHEHQTVVENIKALIKTAQILHLQVLATEQEKLGAIVPELQGLLSNNLKFQKVNFSCCADPAFMRELSQMRKRTVIVCGIETHICVLQSVLDLLTHRYDVLLVRDATSSHALMDRETAMERMGDAGAMIATTEAVIYELTEKAGTEEFRSILELVKERRSLLSA